VLPSSTRRGGSALMTGEVGDGERWRRE
jgi:hypothetical protein